MTQGRSVEDALIITTGANALTLAASASGLAVNGSLPSWSFREKTKAAYAASGTVTFSNAAATVIGSGTTTFACITGTGNTPSVGSNSPVITNVAGATFVVGTGIAGPTGIPAGARIIAVSGTTVTMSANSAGTGTGVNLFAPNPSVPWRYESIDLQPFSQYSTSGSVVPYSPFDGTQSPARRGDRKFPYHIEFDHEGQSFEIVADQNTACTIRVWQNELVSGDFSISATAATGFTKVDFGSRGVRRVCIETDGNLQLVGIRILTTDTISPPSWSSNRKFAIVGDSYALGASINASNISHLAFGYLLARHLGFAENRHYATSGVGVVATGSGVGTYRTKISDVLSYQPDVVLVQGSVNDTGLTGVSLETYTYLTALKAGLPSTSVVVMVGLMPVHTPTAAEITTNASYASGCVQAGVPYIDAVTLPWITGNGTVGSPDGTGNADIYHTSLVHPNAAGSAYLARRIAAALAPYVGGAL